MRRYESPGAFTASMATVVVVVGLVMQPAGCWPA
jgi:hypothetical protein